jgi:ubiquinone/menaquinone biosynthesis C-methylase UbiE
MPSEEIWQEFFAPEAILKKLGLTSACKDVVEFGCGYGTFTIPAARIISGIVYALDIEPEMLKLTGCKAEEAGIHNIDRWLRDFAVDGSGLPDASVDYAMLFNILHAEERMMLIQEAWRVLKGDGKLGIIHWNYDTNTLRGPSMSIRPRPEQCRAWAEQVGFALLPPGLIDLPPYHYGFVFRRPAMS